MSCSVCATGPTSSAAASQPDAGGEEGTRERPEAPPPAGSGVSPVEQRARAAGPETTPGPVSEARANELFQQLAARSDLAYDWPRDCCYTRAQIACAALESAGASCSKIWVHGTSPLGSLVPTKPDGTPVSVPSRYSLKPTPVRWLYHVAPVVPVLREDGTLTEMVLDPSLATRPVSVEAWKKQLGDAPDLWEERSSGKTFLNNRRMNEVQQDPEPGELEKNLADHALDRDEQLGAAARARPQLEAEARERAGR